MRYFDRLHPISALIYFIFILLICTTVQNPVVIAVCFSCNVVFYGILCGAKKAFSRLAYTLPVIIIIAFTNSLFVHKGNTVLIFINDTPITLEATLYGLCSATTLACVFFICSSFSYVFTSEKFIYIFGRIFPKLSLILSMTLGFIPRMKKKFEEIDESQRTLGLYTTDGFFDRIKAKFRVLSVLLTNSLENSVECADSMRARGYGLHGRSSYSNYKFSVSDGIFSAVTGILGILSIILIMNGVGNFDFYPVISNFPTGTSITILYISVLILAFLPVFVEVKENILWHYLKLKI